jgi:hypothetical protein
MLCDSPIDSAQNMFAAFYPLAGPTAGMPSFFSGFAIDFQNFQEEQVPPARQDIGQK